jgi:hypothetical protein
MGESPGFARGGPNAFDGGAGRNPNEPWHDTGRRRRRRRRDGLSCLVTCLVLVALAVGALLLARGR